MAIEKIENYVAPVKVNPYVADLAEAAVGDVFAVNIATSLSPTTGKVIGITGERAQVQEGARANGFTARIQEQSTVAEPTEESDGTYRIVFKLFPAQKSGPRKPVEAEAPVTK